MRPYFLLLLFKKTFSSDEDRKIWNVDKGENGDMFNDLGQKLTRVDAGACEAPLYKKNAIIVNKFPLV